MDREPAADEQPGADEPRGADDQPVFTVPDEAQDTMQFARPGVVVWLGEDVPDEDEVDRAAAMRRHPASTRTRHLRAVS